MPVDPDDIDSLEPLLPEGEDPSTVDDIDSLEPLSVEDDPVVAAQQEVAGDYGDAALGVLDGLLQNFGGEIGEVGEGLGNVASGAPWSAEGVNPVDDAMGTQKGRMGNVAGGVASGVALGAATGGVGGYGAQAGIGALQNVVSGIGRREGDERFDAGGMATDAALGGAFGAGGRALGNVLGKYVARAGMPRAQPVMAPAEAIDNGGAQPLLNAIRRARPAPAEVPPATAYDDLILRNEANPSYVPEASGLDLQSVDPMPTMVDRASREFAGDTLQDIPYAPGTVGVGRPSPRGPNGTARMAKPVTVNMRPGDTARDIPYDYAATMADMTSPGNAATVSARSARSELPTVQTSAQDPSSASEAVTAVDAPIMRDTLVNEPGAWTRGGPVPQPAPPSAPFRRAESATLGAEVPELLPPAAQEGIRQPGALAAAGEKPGDGWAGILPYAADMLRGKFPVRAAGAQLMRKLMSKPAGPQVKPDPRFLKAGAAIGQIWGEGSSSKASAQAPAFVARPDVPTLSWAMQSVNASGDTGLPPDAQQRFDEALLSGDDNRVSSAFMQYSLKYPAFQRRVIKELESINDGE